MKEMKKLVWINESCLWEIGEKIAISRKIEKSWRLIGWGEVLRGTIFDESESG